MKVGIFIDSVASKGGQVRVVANLCDAWVEWGWEVHLITTSHEECGFPLPGSIKRHSLLHRDRRKGIRRVWDNILISIRISQLSHEEDFDGILAISSVESVLLALAKCPQKMTRLGSEHVYARHYSTPWLLGVCRRLFYPKLDGVVCPASQTTEALKEDCPRTNAVNIPNLLIWPHSQNVAKKEPQFDASRRHFVTCGRLVDDKGFDVVIKAFSRIANECPDWDLVIIGEGPSEATLRSDVQALGISDRVLFLGYTDHAHLYYEACDIFVYASPKEGFGMVIAEAQASGLPAICYDCLAGPSDIIRDGQSGLLIRLGDIDAFSHAMIHLAHHDEIRRRMAERAKDISIRLGPSNIVPMWKEQISKKSSVPSGGIIAI